MSANIDKAFIGAYIDADLGLNIAHENTSFNPTAGTEYVELINIPNDITPADLSYTNETDGLFRIILYWPVNKGSVLAKEKADTILTVFPIDTEVCYDSQCATVTKVSREKGVSESGWYKTVITVSYRAFITR